MRIVGTPKTTNVGKRKATSSTSGSGASFEINDDVSSTAASNVAASAPTSSIDALIALQAVDNPISAKKRKVERGLSILETLEDIKLDLLSGAVSEKRLNRLMIVVKQAKEAVDPELDSLLEDIELRALVELAKLGKFPNK